LNLICRLAISTRRWQHEKAERANVIKAKQAASDAACSRQCTSGFGLIEGAIRCAQSTAVTRLGQAAAAGSQLISAIIPAMRHTWSIISPSIAGATRTV
jgi:hypothetical protein